MPLEPAWWRWVRSGVASVPWRVVRGQEVEVARDGWMRLVMTTPTGPVLRWAAGQVSADAKVVAVKGLPGGSHPWLLGIQHGAEMTRAVLRIGDPDHPEWLATEAAALALACDRKLATPRLLGVDLAGAAGMPLLLMTVLAGSSKVPEVASTRRLRALGVAAAALHQVALTPRPALPLRLRPVPDADFAAERRPTGCGSSALLEAAEARLQELPVPAGPTVFVHGDLWQGNTMWTGETLVGIVDWDQAGAGHPGVDLGWLRLDAAILFGPSAAAEILDGWRRATGYEPDAVAYWDVVAALNSPLDLVGWLPPFHRQGRSDLDAATLTGRRDAFLRVALDRLDRGRAPRQSTRG